VSTTMNAGGDVVKRASYDCGFPSKLPELELNLRRSAKWSQQLIQPLEVGCAKWLYANSFVNTKNDGVRPGIGDLSGDDVPHSGLADELIVPFIPPQFRRGQLFGEPHPCPFMTH
jgi:hypothetical protein